MGFNGLIWCLYRCLVFVLVFVSMFGVCISGAGFNGGFWWELFTTNNILLTHMPNLSHMRERRPKLSTLSHLILSHADRQKQRSSHTPNLSLFLPLISLPLPHAAKSMPPSPRPPST